MDNGLPSVILTPDGIQRAVRAIAKNAKTVNDSRRAEPMPNGLMNVGIKLEIAAEEIVLRLVPSAELCKSVRNGDSFGERLL